MLIEHNLETQLTPLSYQIVPKGTNGGVSGLGTAASVAGGLFLGIVFYGVGLLTTRGSSQADGVAAEQWKAVPVAAWAGLVGSLVDSVAGATLQYSGLDGKLKKVCAKLFMTFRSSCNLHSEVSISKI